MPEAATKSTASHDAIGPRGKYARSDGTRARILQAALTEAGESGFQKTSVAKIAVRAGVAVGVVNYHFGSKGELLRELMASLTRDLHSRLYLAMPATGGDFFDHERAGIKPRCRREPVGAAVCRADRRARRCCRECRRQQ